MKQRKTLPVTDLVRRINYMLASSDDDRSAGREALAILLEGVLMDTDNYQGFREADPNDPTRRYYL